MSAGSAFASAAPISARPAECGQTLFSPPDPGEHYAGVVVNDRDGPLRAGIDGIGLGPRLLGRSRALKFRQRFGCFPARASSLARLLWLDHSPSWNRETSGKRSTSASKMADSRACTWVASSSLPVTASRLATALKLEPTSALDSGSATGPLARLSAHRQRPAVYRSASSFDPICSVKFPSS